MNHTTSKTSYLTVGNRIPQDFSITKGVGESDITIHAGSYHLALKDAGIEMCNIITYSSILPGIAREIPLPSALVHGSVMESIMAVSNCRKGQRATASIIFGWLHDKKTGKRYGGLVCEYNGSKTESEAKDELRQSLDELYTNGYSGRYDLKGIRAFTKSFIPKKEYGTAIVALCFTSYLYPIIK
ncbi:MAG: pyruvoyl-dependent arginine decarboxylase [Nanoarchaeota archaeon]|nr:pyruvoyl-dependent arginine decarboxylase [Nanoarchaeota archaeon]